MSTKADNKDGSLAVQKTATAQDGNDEAAEARRKRKAIMIQRHEEMNADRHSNDGNAKNDERAKAMLEHGEDAERQSDNINERGRALSVASAASSSDAGSHQDDGDSASRKSKKPQIRYDPNQPMSKEELANWRREHRRVRNRESAAASRMRTRSRITELEGEVEEWKQKYNAAMKRLTTLRKARSGSRELENSST